MNCPLCNGSMNETYDLGGVDYADELATIYECKACGYKEVRMRLQKPSGSTNKPPGLSQRQRQRRSCWCTA